MKHVRMLLMRLSALSLAAVAMFAIATAAKEEKMVSSAVMNALVEQKVVADRASKALAQTPQTTPFSTAPADSFDRSVKIGAANNPQHLCVYDYVRAAGDVTSGAIANDSSQAGLKHIIGITKLDPRTQQFQIIFKDKTKCSHGAFVDLDFVTTVTLTKVAACPASTPNPCLPCSPKPKNECQSATNIVRAHDIYCQPTMTPGQIVGTNGLNEEALSIDTDHQPSDVAAPGYGYMLADTRATSILLNAAGIQTVKGMDMRLVPYVRVEGLTKNVCFGFVPNDYTNYPLAATDASGSGFYEECWGVKGTPSRTIGSGENAIAFPATKEHPEWSEGTLAYQVKSDCVAKVGVVNEVADSLDLPDLFELFTEDQLTQLCGMLEDHFSSQEDMCRYIAKNRFALSRAFSALS